MDRKWSGRERRMGLGKVREWWTVVNRRQGHGRPRLIDARGERRLDHVVQSNRQAFVAQIAQEVNAGSDGKVSEYTVHHSLLCMGPQTSQGAHADPCPLPKAPTVSIKTGPQNNGRPGGLVWWITFYLHHVDGLVHVRCLPGEHMAPGGTMGRRQASGGSVMLWTMFCWETLGPAFHVDVTLTCTTYLSIAALFAITGVKSIHIHYSGRSIDTRV